MIILVPGCTATVRRLARLPKNKGKLGHLHQPRSRNDFAEYAATGLPWAADNDAYKGFKWAPYRAMLEAIRDPGSPTYPLWITLPDMVANAYGTAYLVDGYYGLVEDGGGETPWALVAQDGLEGLDWDWWMGHASCLFIGGSTEWKLSRAAANLGAEAKRRGMWLHMGRVNSKKRLARAFEMGCDSVDGTGVTYAPDLNLPKMLRWLREVEAEHRQMTLFDQL